ncbi:MAG: hypothetical protein LBS99_02730 [Clostridiales bacterium]|nr:hypothetical protein [Clostridiales bacterium]
MRAVLKSILILAACALGLSAVTLAVIAIETALEAEWAITATLFGASLAGLMAVALYAVLMLAASFIGGLMLGRREPNYFDAADYEYNERGVHRTDSDGVRSFTSWTELSAAVGGKRHFVLKTKKNRLMIFARSGLPEGAEADMRARILASRYDEETAKGK